MPVGIVYLIKLWSMLWSWRQKRRGMANVRGVLVQIVLLAGLLCLAKSYARRSGGFARYRPNS